MLTAITKSQTRSQSQSAGAFRGRDPGAVDEHVDSPEPSDGVRHEPLRVGPSADVACHRHEFGAGRPDPSGHGVEAVLREIG